MPRKWQRADSKLGPLVRVSFKLPAEDVAWLEEQVEKHGGGKFCNKSQVVRWAINLYRMAFMTKAQRDELRKMWLIAKQREDAERAATVTEDLPWDGPAGASKGDKA